jgi:hypothetical protein
LTRRLLAAARRGLERLGEHRAAALLFALAVLLYLWPALVGGKVLSPAAAAYAWVPWSSFRPDDLGDYYNSLLHDEPTQFHVWKLYARNALEAGEFPAWNHLALSGTPFFANAQAALLSPFNLPFWTLPFDYAFGLSAALKLWVAAFGVYLLVRELGLGFGPGMVAGLTFGFCAFSIVWLSHPHLGVFVLLPWALWSTERLLRRGRSADGLGLALAFAVACLGGHPGSQLHLAGAIAVYAVLRALLSRTVGRERVRRLAVVAVAAALGVAVAAVSLLPAALLVPGSAGEAVRDAEDLKLPASALRTALFPDWWGRPSAISFEGPVNFSERTLYAGAAGLVLAVLAATSRAAWRRKLPFVVLALLGLVIAFSVPPLGPVFSEAPILDDVRNLRLIVLFQLAVAVLAAYGAHELIGEGVPRRGWLVAGGALAVAMLAGASIGPSVRELDLTLDHFLTGTDHFSEAVISLTSVAWALLLLSLLVGLLAARKRIAGTAFAAGVIAIVAVDLAHFGHGYQPAAPPDEVFPPPTPALRFLQREAGESRVIGIGLALKVFPSDTGMAYGLRDARGYDPPEPGARYLNLWRQADPPFKADRFTVRKLTSRSRKLMDVLGVRYVLTDPSAAPLARPGLSVAYEGEDARVYRNDRAAPRALVPDTVRAIPPIERSALDAIMSADFDPRTDAVVEVGRARPTVPVPGAGSVRVVRETPSTVELRARLRRAGLVVLNDRIEEGWEVSIDGRDARPIRTNSVFRGVEVPAGSHEVTWRYTVPGLREGAAISALGICGTLAWGLVLLRRRRARRAG